jgi:AcrR family transcriptional regulator
MTNETHHHILDVAETLFFQRGYASVRLRDIADEIGIKHAALYYYAPGGKEDLFVQVLERSFKRHQNGMEEAIQVAGDDVREQMQAVAHWLMSQPPVNIARMGESDFHAISPANAARLSQMIFDALRLPLTEALERAQKIDIVNLNNPGLAAITFVSLVEMIHGDNSPYMTGIKGMIIDQLIDMQLYGWLKR